MKKILLLITVIIIGLNSSAQFRYAGLVAYNSSSLKFNQDLIDINSVSGFKAGVMGELMFPGIGFGIDIGGLYSLEGATVHFGQKEVWSSDGYDSPRLFLHYLEIPVNLKFKWTKMQGLEDYIAPYVFAGPTFQFLLGHSKMPAINYTVCTVGLQLGIGIELYKNWQVQGAYNWGMSSALHTKKLDDFSARNRVWTVSVLRYF